MGSKEKILILVADGDDVLRLVINKILTDEGYDVIEAEDGMKAIEVIKNNDLRMIITDIVMPFISGFELIHYVRTELTSDIPIVVLSSVGQEENIEHAYDLGANEFIKKPFIPFDLKIKIKKLLKL